MKKKRVSKAAYDRLMGRDKKGVERFRIWSLAQTARERKSHLCVVFRKGKRYLFGSLEQSLFIVLLKRWRKCDIGLPEVVCEKRGEGKESIDDILKHVQMKEAEYLRRLKEIRPNGQGAAVWFTGSDAERISRENRA